MFEYRSDVVTPAASDAATEAERRAPGDAEATALVSDVREAPVITDDQRDNEALRTAPDAVAADDSGEGEVRIPRQHGDAEHAPQNGKAAIAAGALSMHEVTAKTDHETAAEPAPDRLSGAQARYELGMMPLAIGARERAGRMADDAAARLHKHHVDAATGEAWQLLGQQANGSSTEAPAGMVSKIAEKTGGSLDSANAGLMQATLLRLEATTNETRTSSRGQGTDQHAEADTAETTGKVEKVSLSLQANRLRQELARTDRPLPPGKRAELHEAHDRTVNQLREQMREEQRAAREATSADLREYFANTGQDAETVISSMLAQAGREQETADGGSDSREDFGAMALASYVGLRGLSPMHTFPEHAPSALDLLAMDAEHKEQTYVQLVARRGLESRLAASALDAAYEADRTYAAALNQAVAAEMEARDERPNTADQLEINPVVN